MTRRCAAKSTAPSAPSPIGTRPIRDSLLFRQIARCARARLISVQIELDQPLAAIRLADELARLYANDAPAQPVEDWPLLIALREIRFDERARAGFAQLSALAATHRRQASRTDPQAAFDSLLQRSRAAEAAQQYDDMARLQQEAVRMLTSQRGLERYSMPFYRHALDELATTRDGDIGTLARRDPAFANRTLATYTGLYDTLLRQAQTQFVGDAREQLFFQYKIDNSLHALAELATAMPRSSGDIADTTFQLAQLRSFGRLTLATLSAELARTPIDPQSRFSVERFFSLSTQTAVWLRGLLDTTPDSRPARRRRRAKHSGRSSSRSMCSTTRRRRSSNATWRSCGRRRPARRNSRRRGHCRCGSSSAGSGPAKQSSRRS